jgi:hypothetical protein
MLPRNVTDSATKVKNPSQTSSRKAAKGALSDALRQLRPASAGNESLQFDLGASVFKLLLGLLGVVLACLFDNL